MTDGLAEMACPACRVAAGVILAWTAIDDGVALRREPTSDLALAATGFLPVCAGHAKHLVGQSEWTGRDGLHVSQ